MLPHNKPNASGPHRTDDTAPRVATSGRRRYIKPMLVVSHSHRTEGGTDFESESGFAGIES